MIKASSNEEETDECVIQQKLATSARDVFYRLSQDLQALCAAHCASCRPSNNGSSRSSTLRARCICMALGGWPWFAWSSQMCPVCVRRRMGSCAQAAFGGRDGMNMRGGESAASQACRRGGRHRRPRRRRRPPATAPTHGRRSLRVPATHLGAPAPTAAPGPSTILLPATSDWSGPRCDEAPSPVGACIP